MFKYQVTEAFRKAGIWIDGGKEWEIQVENPKFYDMVALGGHDSFAKAYVEGYWNCDSVDQCLERMLAGGMIDRARFRPANFWRYITDRLANKQDPEKSRTNVRSHYDLGAVFDIMLDPTMSYSCGFWQKAATLEEAQIAKLDLVCAKLGLQPGMSFCDIGCGWGALVRHASRMYRCTSVGITLSPSQAAYASQNEAEMPGPDTVPTTFIEADYRKFSNQKFDAVASVGMFEHVGHKNYRDFMHAVKRLMTSKGLFLLHTIGSHYKSPSLRHAGLSWMQKNIFEGGALPSLGQIFDAAEGVLKPLDVQNIGPYYDPTIMAWYGNFKRGWPKIRGQKIAGTDQIYDERFYRKWCYYLCACAAMFRVGELQVYQVVFGQLDRREVYKGYRPKSSAIRESVR